MTMQIISTSLLLALAYKGYSDSTELFDRMYGRKPHGLTPFVALSVVYFPILYTIWVR
jgi:hypothetical protein